MSHFQNVFIHRGKTLEGEELNGFGKLKNKRKSNKNIYKSPTLEKSNIDKILNQSFNNNEIHSPKQRQSLKKVALGIQNFISKVLVDNSNDTKYFDVKEELEEIKKAKQQTLKHKDFYHINEGNENINKYLNFTYDNEKKNNFHSTKQIGLAFFKKNDTNKKNMNKYKKLRTMTDDNLKKLTHQDNSFSSTHKFLTVSNKNNSSQSNDITTDPLNPLNKDYNSQLRKTSYDDKKVKDNNSIKNAKKKNSEGILTKITNNSSSLRMSINTLRNIIENGVQNKKNSNDNNSKRKSNDNNNQKINNSYEKNSQKNIKTYENNNNLHLKLSVNENNTQKKSELSKEKKNEVPFIFNRRKNKERSQMINKWLIYSRIMAISNPKSNDDLIKFSRRTSSTRKVFQTINPISSKRLQRQLKQRQSELNHTKRNSSKSNLTKYNENDNSRPKLSKQFSRSKFRKFTRNNKSNFENIIHPKKSKTSFEREKNNEESLLNLESLKQNILKPEYKSFPMDPNLSIVEHKSYLEEGNNKVEIGSINFDVENIKETRYRRMMRMNKLVYDSLSDEESDDSLDENEYISPTSQFKYYFDLSIFIFSFYTFCVNPILLCFYPKHNFPFIFWYNFINIIIDLVYVSDLIIGFFTAYYDIEERYIKKLSEIAIYYLSNWFTIDFLSAIPFTTIYTIKSIKYKTNYSYSGDYKLYELFEIFRLFKIYKAIYNNEFFHFLLKSLNKDNNFEKYFILGFYSLIVILHGHLLACINIFLSNLDYPNWVTVQNLNNSPKTDIYIASFYYIFSTVTTVGYGDIVSINIYERFNNLILLVVGIMVYSYCVSSLSNYVQQVDSKTLDYQEKSKTLEQIRLNHEKMPQELYEKISRFLKYKLTNESKVQNELIDNLPIGLRSTLIMEMYKPVINNFIFFKTFNSSDFIIKVIMAFRPILSLKNEKLINEGDYIEEIVFVKKGTLALELPLPIYVSDKEIEGYLTRKSTGNYTTFEFNRAPSKKRFSNERPIVLNFNERRRSTLTFIKGKGMTKVTNNSNAYDNNIKHVQQYVKIIEIRKNEHFGDILMFLNKRSPLSVKVKSKYCELFLLKKTEAVEISMDFPSIWRKIIKKSLFNMEQIERLINKTLKFFYIQNDRTKRKSYYLRDLNNTNTFVNTDYYANLNEKDYELQSIPTSSIENISSYTEKNSLQIISSEEDSSSNYSKSESKSFYSSSNMSSLSKTRKLSNLSVDKTNDNNISVDLKNQNKRFLKRGNETIKEEISDEENDTNIKNSIIKKKSSTIHNNNNKNNLFGKVTEKEEEDSSNRHVIFSSSSSSNNSESKKTMKETEEYNLIDFNSFSSRNNTIVYPYSKSEINKEELPFENNISAIEKNNNIIHNIVPKFYDIFGKPENLIGRKFTKETNFTTSSFSINIQSTKNKNTPTSLLISHEKDLVVVKNESFMINVHRRGTYRKYNSVVNYNNLELKNFNKKQDKKLNEEERELQKLKNDFIRKENKEMNKTFKEKSKSRRFSKMIIESDSQFNNDKKKENPKFARTSLPNNKIIETSKETLNLIGKNIESNSLALNNPKMFYQNYFSNVVQKTSQTSQRKSVVIRLKDLEKMIKQNNPTNNMNHNRYSVGMINTNLNVKPETKYRHGSIEIGDFNKKDET